MRIVKIFAKIVFSSFWFGLVLYWIKLIPWSCHWTPLLEYMLFRTLWGKKSMTFAILGGGGIPHQILFDKWLGNKNLSNLMTKFEFESELNCILKCILVPQRLFSPYSDKKKFIGYCVKLDEISPCYLMQLCCCTLCDALTSCGSLCLLFFYCTMNSFPTMNSLPTVNSVTHTLQLGPM